MRLVVQRFKLGPADNPTFLRKPRCALMDSQPSLKASSFISSVLREAEKEFQFILFLSSIDSHFSISCVSASLPEVFFPQIPSCRVADHFPAIIWLS